MPSGDPPSIAQESPRILLIDSYDSFTYNLASLCKRAIPNCIVHIIKNDQIPFAKLEEQLKRFHAVIIGPGPGSPDNEKDIAVVRDVWKLADENLLPVFGVCLGLQSLGIEFGATLRRLNVVKHGQISHIEHHRRDIYMGVGDVQAVRYHSLHVTLGGEEPLIPLAWANDEENGRVLMAMKHASKPFWAVQYHPESVRTQGGGDEVLRNFWRLAKKWLTYTRRQVKPWSARSTELFGDPWPHLHLVSTPKTASSTKHALVHTRILSLPDLAVTDICEMLGVSDESSDFVMLDSAAQPGRHSIIGVLSAVTPKISFRVGEQRVRIERADAVTWEAVEEDIWTWLAGYMRNRRAKGGEEAVPFWGGLIGFLSYELGVDSLTKDLPPRVAEQKGKHPDVNLVFVERSIVLDSMTGSVYVQSILPEDDEWLASTASQLQAIASVRPRDTLNGSNSKRRRIASTARPAITLPNKDEYISKIKQAQEFLFSGNSYELCLTAPTRISVPNTSPYSGSSSSWHLYKTLRQRNPAPHSAYLRMHPSTLISSSPERFLSYSRPPNSVCQLRPIKGTVRKAPGVTRSVAERALIGSVKEVAENLMIVDLIRHDLHGVVGEDVETRQFCGVEEYETVWQLVSVIEGKLPPGTELDAGHEVGWEVLRRSLPPGSMTGAPKKRSVEILHSLEGRDRNVYSGVFGYWCVGGGGDWSVTIRSCFKFEDDTKEESSSTEWLLGAGGAITALSDPEAEWDEMVVKVESVLRAFQAAAE